MHYGYVRLEFKAPPQKCKKIHNSISNPSDSGPEDQYNIVYNHHTVLVHRLLQMDFRKTLPNDTKAKAQVRYHLQWPYISLRLPDGTTRLPDQSIEVTVKKFYTLGLATVNDADPYMDTQPTTVNGYITK